MGNTPVGNTCSTCAAPGPGGTPATTPAPVKKPIIDIQIVDFTYLTDHKVMLDKTDDWQDPVTPAELKKIADSKPEYVRGANGNKARPISHTWSSDPATTSGPIEKMTAYLHVKVDPPDCDPEGGILIGTSNLPHVSFKSQRITFSGGMILVFVEADAPLPREINVLENVSVQWSAQTDLRTISNSGTSIHEIYVTAGDPVTAASWPMTDNQALPGGPKNHNFFTAYRMKFAAKSAPFLSKPHDIVNAIWGLYFDQYDLSAPGNMNPWNLATRRIGAQCMTICAFFQSVAGMLGLKGDVVYVYPTFDEPPTAPNLTKSYNGVGRCWVAASTEYQPVLRQITAPPHSSKTKHHKYRMTEYIAMIDNAGVPQNDWTPGWNSYEATFQYNDGTTTKYYAGGGGVADSPRKVLDNVCAFVAWCYNSNTVCNPPGPARWWGPPRTPWPPKTLNKETLPG
jgi:hypothetical protein